MSCKVTIPSKPFHGPKSKAEQGCCRVAPQDNSKGRLVLPVKPCSATPRGNKK